MTKKTQRVIGFAAAIAGVASVHFALEYLVMPPMDEAAKLAAEVVAEQTKPSVCPHCGKGLPTPEELAELYTLDEIRALVLSDDFTCPYCGESYE